MTLYLRLELHLPQMPWISSIRTVGPAAVAVAAAAEAAAAAPASSSAFSLLLVCASLLVYRLLPETITHLPTQLVCQPARLTVRLTVRLAVRLTACLPFCPSVVPSVAVCLAVLYSRQRMQSPYAINCRLVTTFPRKSVKV